MHYRNPPKYAKPLNVTMLKVFSYENSKRTFYTHRNLYLLFKQSLGFKAFILKQLEPSYVLSTFLSMELSSYLDKEDRKSFLSYLYKALDKHHDTYKELQEAEFAFNPSTSEPDIFPKPFILSQLEDTSYEKHTDKYTFTGTTDYISLYQEELTFYTKGSFTVVKYSHCFDTSIPLSTYKRSFDRHTLVLAPNTRILINAKTKVTLYVKYTTKGKQ